MLAATPQIPTPAATPGQHSATLTNSIGMEFVWITNFPGGGAYVGKYEVTCPQYLKVMGQLPSNQAERTNEAVAVQNVAFQAAQQFCIQLSKLDNKKYALPSKAEWLAFADLSDDRIIDIATYLNHSGRLEHEVTSWNLDDPLLIREPALVGSRGGQPNGLCDVIGNVREWLIEGEGAGLDYVTQNNQGAHMALFSKESKMMLKKYIGLRCVIRNN